jgi:hypothetical protein
MTSVSLVLNKPVYVVNQTHLSYARISILGIPGSTYHCRGVEPGSEPEYKLEFLATIISIITGLFAIS